MAKKPRLLPEMRVTLERVQPGEKAVTGKYPDNLGLRTKLGGKPNWIHQDCTPDCKRCGNPMSFVAQIDSIEHESKHNPLSTPYREQKWMFSDVGMIYVFYCFDCGEPACLDQFSSASPAVRFQTDPLPFFWVGAVRFSRLQTSAAGRQPTVRAATGR